MNEDMPDPTDGRVHFYRDADDRLFVSQPSLTDVDVRVWSLMGRLNRDWFNAGFPGWRTARGIVRCVAFPLVEVEIVDKEETK